MIYRKLGKTGYTISQLGFGAMRLPMTGDGENALVDRDLAIPMIHRAFGLGINYIDTARGYCNTDSQRAVGEALESWQNRKNIVVSTKNPYFGKEEKVWWQNLEDSLRRLRVDSIDIYNFHGISWKIFTENIEPYVSKWMQKAFDQGLVKHICCSFHDTNESLVKIIDTGCFESITLQYNMLDRKLDEGIAYAHEKELGVIVMGPVGGGRLAEPSVVMKNVISGGARIHVDALKFVLSNQNISGTISGMSSMQQVEENAVIADKRIMLSEDDLTAINNHLDTLNHMADLYCTGCGYCIPCPQGVSIPRIFEMYNQARIYDIWEISREVYNWIGTTEWEPGKQADACTECGECEEKCPQNIPIRKQLTETHTMLGSK